MADVVSPEIRSYMMSGIRDKNTRPEIILRKLLHAKGFRYKLHDKSLPGKPDIVLPKYRAVVFAHGCFWHLHDCHLFKWPSTRPDFWKQKISNNEKRDRLNERKLSENGWRIAIVWECALRGKGKKKTETVADGLTSWLTSNKKLLKIEGHL